MKKAKLKLLSVITALTLVSSFGITVKAESKSFSNDQLKSILAESYQNNLLQNSKLSESLKEKLGIKNPEDGSEVKSTSNKSDENQVTRIIVQLTDNPAITTESSKDKAKTKEASLKSDQNSVISQVESITGTKVKRSFGYLVNGFSIEAKVKDVSKIAALKGVKKVFEANVYKPDMYYAKQITGATNVWSQNKYKGEGMVVAIIDTGIDYSHKDLKITDPSKDKLTQASVKDAASKLNHGKFYTDKVPYAYNYADNNDNVIDTTGEMHGMHVAGIVAANGADDPTFKSVAGVAPEAQLLDMKVFSNNPENSDSAYDDDIIAAIEDSVKLGADVINMSLGSFSGFNDADSPEQVAVNNATDAGVLVCVAAGNAGESTNTSGWNQPKNMLGIKDTSTVGSPGTTPSALTVASMENTSMVGKALSVNIGNNPSKFAYADVEGDDYSSLNTPHQLVDCGLGNPSDFDKKDLSGKIALIKRGSISFTDKVTNADKAGAAGVIIFNNDGKNDFIQMTVTNHDIPAISLGNTDGQKLLDNISSVSVSISGEMMGVENVDKDDMSQYTSWGPTESLDFKPEITAPGGDIYSLANNNGYQSMSGTSMATPNTAGSEALIIQSLKARGISLTGKAAAEFAKHTVMNTATVMKDKYNAHAPYSPRRQGAGLINMPSAVTNNVIITDSAGDAAVALRSFSEDTKSFSLTLTNYGKTDATYTLPATNLLSEYDNAPTTNVDTPDLYEDVVPGAKVSFDKSNVTVPAGGTTTVNVTINIPGNFAKDNFVEGFVGFNSSNASIPSLSVPFMGFYGDWAALNIVDKPANDANSLIGNTWLGTSTDKGFAFIDNDDYDPAKLGFSPNNDNLQDLIIPNLYMLRNAKNVTVEILDKNKNLLSTLYTENNVSKTSLEDFGKGATIGKTLSNAKWDGTIYDQASGKYIAQKEGQYYYRILATADYTGAKAQATDIPVKIDTTAPTEAISSVTANVDGTYHVVWTASDAGTGLYPDDILISVNGSIATINNGTVTDSDLVKNYKADGNSFSADVAVNANSINSIAIGMLDNAENIAISSKDFEVGTAPKVQITNLQNGSFVSGKDLVSGTYKVLGEVSSDVASLTLNGANAEIKNNSFEASVPLTEGNNTISVVGKDASAKTIYTGTLNATLDSKNPDLSITTPGYSNDDSFIKASASSIDITGAVQDANLAQLFIGSTEVTPDKAQGTFKATVKLVDGLNDIQVNAVDFAGNSTIKHVKVLYADPNAAFTVKFNNLSGFMSLNAGGTKNDVYTITGSVNHTIKNFTINDAPVSVKPDNTFSVDVKLNQGTNVVKLYAEDNGVVYYNYGYRILYDSKGPQITLTSPIARADGKVYTNSNTINLTGTITDNLYGYILYVNGNAVINNDKYPSNDPSVLTKTFNVPLTVNDGDYITLDAVDELGNETLDKVQVAIDKTAPATPGISLSTSELTNKPVNISFSDTDKDIDHYEYSFDGSSFDKYTGTLAVQANATIYARAVDFAGNVSSVSSLAITNIDTTAPDIKVSGISDGGVYTQAVTPQITSTDNTASVVATLNGAPYTAGTLINTVGDYNLSAYTVDKAGNKSPVSNINFKLGFITAVTTSNGTSTIVVNENSLQSTSEVVGFTVTGSPSIGLEIPYATLNASNKALALNGDNVSLSLPTDIFGKEAGSKISLTATLNTTIPTSGIKIAGKAYDFNLYQTDADGTTKHITNFNGEYATVVMKLTADDIKGLDTSRLTAYSYNESTKAWEEIGGTFDAATSTLTFKAPHFSTYAVAEKPAATPATNGGTPTKLVQTGYMLDSTVLSGIGIIFIVSGAAIVLFRRRKTE